MPYSNRADRGPYRRLSRIIRKAPAAAILIACGIGACFGGSLDGNNAITIIGEGFPVPVIVHSNELAGTVAPLDKGDGDPLVKYAALDLQRYLLAATGKRLEIGPERADAVSIHVGRTRYVKALRLGLEHLDYDGFIIATRLRGDVPQVIIAGRTPYGTYYGVNYFLREYVGVNWLFPGKLGEVVPERKTIRIPAMLDDKQEPDFIRRAIAQVRRSGPHNLRSLLTLAVPAGSRFVCEPDETNPHPRFSTQKVVRIRAWHGIHKIIPPDLFSSNPEYFPMIDGERRKPTRLNVFWQPCYSNPEVVQRFIDAAREHFDESPYNLCFSIAGLLLRRGEYSVAPSAGKLKIHGNYKFLRLIN